MLWQRRPWLWSKYFIRMENTRIQSKPVKSGIMHFLVFTRSINWYFVAIKQDENSRNIVILINHYQIVHWRLCKYLQFSFCMCHKTGCEIRFFSPFKAKTAYGRLDTTENICFIFFSRELLLSMVSWPDDLRVHVNKHDLSLCLSSTRHPEIRTFLYVFKQNHKQTVRRICENVFLLIKVTICRTQRSKHPVALPKIFQSQQWNNNWSWLLDSNPAQVVSKTCETAPAPSRCALRYRIGARERIARGAAIVLPPMQHSLASGAKIGAR